MSSILTNTSAMSALSLLSQTQRNMQTAQVQVSSGLRIATASDDAAYWSIGVAMRSQVSTLSAVNDGLALTKSIASVTTTAVNQIIGIMQGLQKDLITAQQPGVDLSQVQQDITAKQQLIVGIANSASFGGQNWLVQHKTADVKITEEHHLGETFQSFYANAAANVQARDPMPAFTPVQAYDPRYYYVGSSTPVPNGYYFDDDLTYGATASETDAGGARKEESTSFAGTDQDQAYRLQGWSWSKDPGDPASPFAWHPASWFQAVRNRYTAVPDAVYSDTGSVDFSDAETLRPPLSSSSDGLVLDSIDTTQFTLFTNYTGTTDVVEKTYDSAGDSVRGSILTGIGARSHQSTDPYSSYNVDNGFEENVGALDANLYGSDASTFRKTVPEDDLGLGTKTTVLNFNVDGSDFSHGADVQGMLVAIDSDMASLTTMSARLGSLSNRIDTMTTFNGALSDAISAGVGSLTDADMNVASTRLQALQTQQQLGIQSLSIANQNGQLLLKLFGAA